MRVLIAYYSHSNSTEQLAFRLKSEFESQGHQVDTERILASKEHSFLGWFFRRTIFTECDIISPKITDAESYDLLCIGSPNWTQIALPVARYLKVIKNLAYKKVGLFSTTAFWPDIEWYIYSAYSLENTFFRTVEKRRGRPISVLLLSSIFKSKGIESQYGKQAIGDFCRKMISPFASYKNYILSQKDLKEAHFLATIFLTVLPLIVVVITILAIYKNPIVSDWRFWIIIISYAALCIRLMEGIHTKKRLNLSRYLVTSVCVVWWTIIMSLFSNIIGDIAVYGYLLIVIFSTLFQDSLLIFILGIIVAVNYILIIALFPPTDIISFRTDIAFFYTYLVVALLISRRMRHQSIAYNDAQDDIETVRDSLDIRVKARTRELTDLTMDLDKKVKERTAELEEKLDILEKFSKLTVGRELKIIALKEELAILKKQLESDRQ